MTSDMERIKAALADVRRDAAGSISKWANNEGPPGNISYSIADAVLDDAALHTAILSLIREMREECAGVVRAKAHKVDGTGECAVRIMMKLQETEAAIRALSTPAGTPPSPPKGENSD